MVDLDGETLRRITHGDGGDDEASLGPSSNFGEAAERGWGHNPVLRRRWPASRLRLHRLESRRRRRQRRQRRLHGRRRRRLPCSGHALDLSRPEAEALQAPRRLTLSAFSLPSGAVQLVAVVPAAGALRARATGSLGVDAPPRSLALATRRARKRGGGLVRLTLDLPRRLRRLSHSREGVYATARVSFRRHGGGACTARSRCASTRTSTARGPADEARGPRTGLALALAAFGARRARPPPNGTPSSRVDRRHRGPMELGEIGDIEFWAPNRGVLITAGNGGVGAGDLRLRRHRLVPLLDRLRRPPGQDRLGRPDRVLDDLRPTGRPGDGLGDHPARLALPLQGRRSRRLLRRAGRARPIPTCR